MESAGEEDAKAPEAYEDVDAEGCPLEGAGGEDAAVEADDGDFDEGTEGEVGELVGEEDLSVLVGEDGM